MGKRRPRLVWIYLFSASELLVATSAWLIYSETAANTIAIAGAGIPICEHMTNLAAAASGAGRLHAIPIAWVGDATFPVRAYRQ